MIVHCTSHMKFACVVLERLAVLVTGDRLLLYRLSRQSNRCRKGYQGSLLYGKYRHGLVADYSVGVVLLFVQWQYEV